MSQLPPSRALETLNRCHANANFFTLSSEVVESLLAEADILKYRKPKNAPGSRARMFHAYLVRRAESLTGLCREEVRGKSAVCTMRRGRRSVTVASWDL